jgi:uncharacterized DUF497 family protein
MHLTFEWSEKKAKENLKKHRISFEEAKTIFNDPLSITFLDEYHSLLEQRYISIGLSASSRLLLVAHTENQGAEEEKIIRIISSRKATPLERRRYEEE